MNFVSKTKLFNVISAITLIFSFQAQALPLPLVGEFQPSGEVDALTAILREVTYSDKKAQELRKQGFTCERVTNAYRCRKIEKVESLPASVAQALLNKAPQSIRFLAATGDYALTNDAISLTEWEKEQSVQIGEETFDTVIWRELKDGPTKVVVQKDNQREEFLWLGNQLGRVESTSVTIPGTQQRAEYWGVVKY